MTLFAKHNCGDSKLSCVQCGNQICPKCLVSCPVGNRCNPCASKTESHAIKVTLVVAVRTGVACLAAEAAFSWLTSVVPTFGFFSWIITYAAGLVVGNLLHRLSGYKLGTKISALVVASLAVGALASSVFWTARAFPQADYLQAMQDTPRPEGAVTQQLPAQKVDSTGGVSNQAQAPVLSPAAIKMRDAQLGAAIARAKSYYLTQQIVALLIFGFGVVSPFASIAPITFGRFKR